LKIKLISECDDFKQEQINQLEIFPDLAAKEIIQWLRNEFLVGSDGTISFLEVNTRLQVEHPVSEEVTGIDLVREQFRIAMGEALGFNDPVIRGHSFEFRINGEDPGRSFLPAPGRITKMSLPTGPGVRVDTGFRTGDAITGNFDSLLAKLIVTGATREQAITRARRAIAEFTIEGMATALPFHQAILQDPAFTNEFKVYTSYIEKEFKKIEKRRNDDEKILENLEKFKLEEDDPEAIRRQNEKESKAEDKLDKIDQLFKKDNVSS
jgi:acetyl/propionyl-CoA carboxylase alpha subunit